MTFFTMRAPKWFTALSTATVITVAAGTTGAAAQGSDSIPGIS